MEILILCLKVFIGRLFDVTLSTMYTMLLVKDKRKLAIIFGFIDILIWFMVVREALNTDIGGFYVALAYAGGFAVGSLIGSSISKLFISGTINVQIITKDLEQKVTSAIKNSSYTASVIESKGLHTNEKNYLIYAHIDIKKIKEFKKLIIENDPKAFITIIENKETLNGYIN